MILLWGLIGTRSLETLVVGQDLLWEYRKQAVKANQHDVTRFNSDGDLQSISWSANVYSSPKSLGRGGGLEPRHKACRS